MLPDPFLSLLISLFRVNFECWENNRPHLQQPGKNRKYDDVLGSYGNSCRCVIPGTPRAADVTPTVLGIFIQHAKYCRFDLRTSPLSLQLVDCNSRGQLDSKSRVGPNRVVGTENRLLLATEIPSSLSPTIYSARINVAPR